MTPEPLAKPSGVTLADHRQHVVDEAERLLGLRPDETPGLPFLASKYARIVPSADLGRRVRRAAWYHDRGKAFPLWQDACQKDYALYRDWRRRRRLDPDAVDADDWNRYYAERRGDTGPNLRKPGGIRHEIASLLLCDQDQRLDLSLPERVAIAAHHGKLGGRHEHRWLTGANGAFAHLWHALVKEDGDIARTLRDDARALRLRYEVAGVRALLQLADTRASRAEAGGALAPVVPFRYTWPHETHRPVQNLALRHADDPITILRAPTGSGKTDAALLWGQHQVDAGRSDRLVIAMPTRFTANALAGGAEASLSGTGLYHSSAWHARYGSVERRTAAFEMAQEGHALARRLASPLTVCTVDHLLLALTGAKEDHHATFFFLANAAVVFDEVDFYDAFVQANLVVLLDALRTLGVPVLLMSATVPESSRTLYSVEADIRATSDDASGVRTIRRHPPVEHPEDAAGVLAEMIDAGTGIVYANTVERAYRYWTYLRGCTDDVPVLLYHSRFTEPDKARIEAALVGTDEIAGALGRRAWETGTARGIAVLTQIGEMSVNISAPLMLSDLCPWDRLAQRAGRLARFKEYAPAGTLHVADPHRDDALYPAPYGSFDGPTGWTAGAPLLETQSGLDALTAGGPIAATPELFVAEVDALYPEPEAPDARTAANTHALRRMVRENWMIVPATETRDDEADVPGQWQSRDIPPQRMVYVLDEADLPEDGPLRFETYGDYHRLGLESGISLPVYLVERGLKRGTLSTVPYVIGHDRDDGILVWVVQDYEAPDKQGVGSGLGVLALREQEDVVGHVIH